MSRLHKQKNRSKLPLISLITLAVILMISALFMFTDIANFFKQKEPKIVVKTDSEKIIDGITLESESKESNTFTSYVAYPFTNIPAIDEPIYEWVTEREDHFYDEMEKIELLLGEAFKAHFSIETTVESIDDDVMSFILEAEEVLEENNSYKQIQPFMVNLNKEKIIYLNHIINETKIDTEALVSKIEEHTNKNVIEEIDEALFIEAFANLQHIKWTINNDHIDIYFNPGEISSSSDIITLSIPIIELNDFITEDYYNIIVSKEIQEELERIEEEKRKKEEEEQKRLEEEQRKKDEEQQQAEKPKNDPPNDGLPNDGKKYVALTFDDGPSSTVTPRVLDALRTYNAKATFFMLGQNAEALPQLAKQIADEGHEIANHSITHANLQEISSEERKKEIIDSIDQIENATGKRPTLFRPPYGSYNNSVIDYALESNQKIIMWSVDTRDWESKNPNAINEIVRNYTKSGSIILLHDIHPTTADALPEMLKYLQDQGYEFLTVTEMLNKMEASGVGPHSGY